MYASPRSQPSRCALAAVVGQSPGTAVTGGADAVGVWSSRPFAIAVTPSSAIPIHRLRRVLNCTIVTPAIQRVTPKRYSVPS